MVATDLKPFPPADTPVRLRAFVLGIALAALICLLTPYNNIYRQGTPLGGGHFPLAPFILLFWLTLTAAVFKRIFNGHAGLNGKEVLIIWILMVLASGIAYTGLVRTFFINLTAPFYYATVENRWAEVLHPLLPESWYPDQSAAKLFYEGLAGGRDMGWTAVCRNIPWRAWLTPLLVWGVFVLTCYGVMICMINLISRQWLHNERMNLPLLRVPQMLEQALDQDGLWKFLGNRFLLTGFFLAAALHLLNGLHAYFPTVPQLPTIILAGPYFPATGLFSGFQKLNIYLYPAFIGFAFLASRQISFSFWFLFLMGGLLSGLLVLLGWNIPASALGVTFGPALSKPEETQMIGAYPVFFVFILWLGRRHFLDILREAFRLSPEPPARTEWLSTRHSFWGMLLGLAAIVWWCRHFGQNPWTAVLLMGVFFMVMLVATRIICQGGVAYYTLTASPLDGILTFFSPRLFTPAGLLIAAVTQKVLFVDLRESLMPSLLHAAEISHREKKRKWVLFTIAGTLIVAVALSFVSMLTLCYKFGAREMDLEWAGRTTMTMYENVKTLTEASPHQSDWMIIFSTLGALVMLVLVIGYHRAYWWPLHPLGYLTAYSSAMRILWFSFLVGWLCNSLCLRYGGVRLFQRVSHLFVGLIIGDFFMAGVFALAGLFSNVNYQVLPV